MKIKSDWSGTSPVTLDPSTPIRKAHQDNVPVVELDTTKGYTTTMKRGASTDPITFLIYLTDINKLALVKGCKVNTISGTYTPGNNPIQITMAIIGQSIQILEKDIFGVVNTIPQANFYVPWEVKIKRDDATINIVESFNFTINNGIDGGAGRALGSRFRQSVREGRGDVTGSFQYQLIDVAILKKMVLDQAVKLEANFAYTGDNNHEFKMLYPTAKLSGGLMPGIPNDGPLNDSKDFDSEYDDATELSDVVITVKSSEYLFE